MFLLHAILELFNERKKPQQYEIKHRQRWIACKKKKIRVFLKNKENKPKPDVWDLHILHLIHKLNFLLYFNYSISRKSSLIAKNVVILVLSWYIGS